MNKSGERYMDTVTFETVLQLATQLSNEEQYRLAKKLLAEYDDPDDSLSLKPAIAERLQRATEMKAKGLPRKLIANADAKQRLGLDE